MGIENIEVLKSERPMKRIFVFANDETRASLYGLKPNHRIGSNESVHIFYKKFRYAEGLRLEEGDWVQVIQELKEKDAEWCVDALVRGALQQGFFLEVLDINTFAVVDSVKRANAVIEHREFVRKHSEIR